MLKRTKKLLVYLDQNFISEMAKAKINERSSRNSAKSTNFFTWDSSRKSSSSRNL